MKYHVIKVLEMSENESSSERLAQLKERLLETEIMAQMPDLVNAHATAFVASLMKDWYQITNDGEFQPTDQVPLRTRDFQPTPVSEISDYLRSEHSYLFRQSAPSGNSNATTAAPPPPNKAEMTLEQKCRFIRLNGEQAYQELPNTAVEAKPLAERHRSEMSVEERARLIRERGSEFYMSLPA